MTDQLLSKLYESLSQNLEVPKTNITKYGQYKQGKVFSDGSKDYDYVDAVIEVAKRATTAGAGFDMEFFHFVNGYLSGKTNDDIRAKMISAWVDLGYSPTSIVSTPRFLAFVKKNTKIVPDSKIGKSIAAYVEKFGSDELDAEVFGDDDDDGSSSDGEYYTGSDEEDIEDDSGEVKKAPKAGKAPAEGQGGGKPDKAFADTIAKGLYKAATFGMKPNKEDQVKIRDQIKAGKNNLKYFRDSLKKEKDTDEAKFTAEEKALLEELVGIATDDKIEGEYLVMAKAINDAVSYLGFEPVAWLRKFKARCVKNKVVNSLTEWKEDMIGMISIYLSRGSKLVSEKLQRTTKVEAYRLMMAYANKYKVVQGNNRTNASSYKEEDVTLPRLVAACPFWTAQLLAKDIGRVVGDLPTDFPKFLAFSSGISLIPENCKGLLHRAIQWHLNFNEVINSSVPEKRRKDLNQVYNFTMISYRSPVMTHAQRTVALASLYTTAKLADNKAVATTDEYEAMVAYLPTATVKTIGELNKKLKETGDKK